MFRALLLLLASVAAAMTWISTAVAAEPVTLVSTQRPITEFVQDDGYVAWSVCPGEPRVTMRALSTGFSRTFSNSGHCEETDGSSFFGGSGLALARSRVLWFRVEISEMDSVYANVATGGLYDPEVRVLQFFWDDGFARPLAGADDTLVYAFLNDINDESEGVNRVRGRARTRIPGVSRRSAVLAAAGRRVALAPARGFGSAATRPARNGPVEVRNAFTGALVTTFNPVGTVLALALTQTRVAVLVKADSGARHIERYSVTTGSLVGSTWVRRGTASRLDMSGSRIVYRIGRDIRLLEAKTGATRLLWRTGTLFPIGVSIEGRRVAWAINKWKRGKIRALWLER
jgi:hypothetical protein